MLTKNKKNNLIKNILHNLFKKRLKSKKTYFIIKTKPKSTKITKKVKKNFWESFNLNNWFRRHKGQKLILVIIGIYSLVGFIIGSFIFFNRNDDTASASQASNITSTIRFNKSDKLSVGESAEIFLTLQNTSITKPVKDITLEFLSSKESIKWNKMVLNGTNNEKIVPVKNNFFKINDLTPGQRLEYIIEGNLIDDNLDIITIVGRINFLNENGFQNIETNRIFSTLKINNRNNFKPLSLKSSKETYNQSEEIILSLQSGNDNFSLDEKIEGKIFLNNRNNGQLISSFDCLPKEKGFCDVNLKTLEVGKYSAIFKNNDNTIYSEIIWFEVTGKTAEPVLIPSESSNLEFPFKNQSYNGMVPVIAKRVISLNKSPDNSPDCIFEVIKDNSVISRTSSPINSDRSCRAELSGNKFNQGDGIYKVKLANTNLQKEISYIQKGEGLLNLELSSQVNEKSQNVEIKLNNVLNTEGKLVENDQGTLYIYNSSYGDLQKITLLNNQKIEIINGSLIVNIPGSYFQNSGNYLIFLNFVSGKKTDFLVLNLNDKDFGFVNSGVFVNDYSNLRIGRDISFELRGITAKDNSIVKEGDCIANFYAVNSTNIPVSTNGQIKDGICKIVLSKNKITKAGPLLISFNGNNIINSINQSRQLNILPGDPVNYGNLNFEYEPAKRGYANSLLIGPVVDSFDNLASDFNTKVSIEDAKGNIINTINNIKIIDGYAKIPIASSILNQQESSLIFNLKDKNDNKLSTKELKILDDKNPLYLPAVPNKLSNNEAIKINYQTIKNDFDKCTVKIYRTKDKFVENSFDFKENECNIVFDLTQNRDAKKILVELTAGNNKYNSILELTSGDASNVFTISPLVRFNKSKELEIFLLTAPLVDKYGMPVENGQIKWKYNGKIYVGNINEGFGQLPILATDLENKDIRNVFNQRFLDLDLDVSSGTTSFNQTNNISLFLGDYDISRNQTEFKILEGSNYISTETPYIFKIKTEFCNVININNEFNITNLKTHTIGSDCYIQVQTDKIGKNKLIIENNGFEYGSFQYYSDINKEDIDWCKEKENNKCYLIQVLSTLNSKVEAIIYDQDKQYKFYSNDLENIVEIRQNGLNPLKEYLVEVNYINSNNQKIIQYRTIIGEKLI